MSSCLGHYFQHRFGEGYHLSSVILTNSVKAPFMNGLIFNETVYIILPVYNDSESLELLLPRIKEVLGNTALYIVVIEDGSTQNVFSVDGLAEHKLNGVVINLIANVGQQGAIKIGLEFISKQMNETDIALIMDSDGEDAPETVPALINQFLVEGTPVVASRQGRQASWSFKFGYQVYKILFSLLTGRSIDFGNFMCLGSKSVKRLVAMPSLSDSLAGTLLLSRLQITKVPTVRSERLIGRSHMNITGLIHHGLRCIRVFESQVLIRLVLFSLLLSALLLVIAAAVLALKYSGVTVSGWTSLALGIVALLLLQIGSFLFLAAITQNKRSSAERDSSAPHALIESVHYNK